jgi:hypothetical protein
MDNRFRNFLRSYHGDSSVEIDGQRMVAPLRDYVRTIPTSAGMNMRLEGVSPRIAGQIVAEPAEESICRVRFVISLDVPTITPLAERRPYTP